MQEELVQEQAEQDDFHKQTIRASHHKGTEWKDVDVFFYRDTGLGYRETAAHVFLLMLESGYMLCSYGLPTEWQAAEACRQLAPIANYHDAEVFATYRQEHHGEKLGDRIKAVLSNVLALSEAPPVPITEQIERLKDFVLDRDNSDQVPPFFF